MTKTEEPSCNLSQPAGRNCHRSDKPNEIVKTRTIKRRTMLWRKRFMPTFSAIIYTDSTFKLWQSIIQTHSAHDQYFTHGSLISVNHLFFQLQSSAVKIYTLLQKKTLTIHIEIFFLTTIYASLHTPDFDKLSTTNLNAQQGEALIRSYQHLHTHLPLQ